MKEPGKKTPKPPQTGIKERITSQRKHLAQTNTTQWKLFYRQDLPIKPRHCETSRNPFPEREEKNLVSFESVRKTTPEDLSSGVNRQNSNATRPPQRSKKPNVPNAPVATNAGCLADSVAGSWSKRPSVITTKSGADGIANYMLRRTPLFKGIYGRNVCNPDGCFLACTKNSLRIVDFFSECAGFKTVLFGLCH